MCDVRSAEAVASMIDQMVTTFGRLDVLVNNAGGAPYARPPTRRPRFHAKVIELNLLAPLLLSQAANRVMQSQATGERS